MTNSIIINFITETNDGCSETSVEVEHYALCQSGDSLGLTTE